MNQETVNDIEELITEREKAIFSSDNPQQAATNYLIEIGYLKSDGTIAQRFRDGLPEGYRDSPSLKSRKKVSA